MVRINQICEKIKTIQTSWPLLDFDFPLFEKTDDGEVQSVHHPFCSIKEEDKENL